MPIDTRKRIQNSKVPPKARLVKGGKTQNHNAKLKIVVKMNWYEAKDIKREIKKLLKILILPHIKSSRIFCFRTQGSKSRSYARIWSFPKIFQRALGVEPAYVIEVLEKHYDKLDDDQKKKVLIHELLHIPKNFSGSLLPHRGRGRHLGRMVNKLFEQIPKPIRQAQGPEFTEGQVRNDNNKV